MRFEFPNGEIYRARVEDIYPIVEPGSYQLLIADGPYGIGKAEWDKFTIPGLVEFYKPHIEAWGSLLAPAATLYFWNTSEGWAAIHPLLVDAGWCFQSLIVWHKYNHMAIKSTAGNRSFPEITELCGMYTRSRREYPVLEFMRAELKQSGLNHGDIARGLDELGGKSNMVRHYFGWSQWVLPSFEQWLHLHKLLNRKEGGPYLQKDKSHLFSREEIQAEYEEWRLLLETLRPPFNPIPHLQNVWKAPLVGSPERLTKADGTALHPCQKPLEFAERMILSSTNPGGRVFVPFGGTCREAFAIERIAREDPKKARWHTTVEMDQDGCDYIEHVAAQIRGEDLGANKAQIKLF